MSGDWGVELARQVPALVVLSWVVWQTGKHAKEAAQLNLELMKRTLEVLEHTIASITAQLERK